MTCQDYAEALLEGLPPPPEALAHGRQCPECRALASLHASAGALRRVEPPPAAPIAYAAILGEVHRRRRQRRRVAAVGVSAALALLAVLVTTRGHAPRSEEELASGGVAVEGAIQIVPQPSGDTHGKSQRIASLGGLVAEVGGYTRTHPGLEDETYRAFGGLSYWVRAPESAALEPEPFHTALAAFAVQRSPQAVE